MLIVKSRKFTDVASSSNSQVRIPKLFVSALKLSQAVGLPLSIQIPNMSSMKHLKSSKYWAVVWDEGSNFVDRVVDGGPRSRC